MEFSNKACLSNVVLNYDKCSFSAKTKTEKNLLNTHTVDCAAVFLRMHCWNMEAMHVRGSLMKQIHIKRSTT